MARPECPGRRWPDPARHHREEQYTRALEIGTSTGHSGIWIAWALSKTGGKLITIEIDEGRHRQALANFEAAGLSKFIDARLGNAHEIVPALAGPFDFVFSDADKDWTRTISTPFCPSSRSVAVMPRTMRATAGEVLAPAITEGLAKPSQRRDCGRQSRCRDGDQLQALEISAATVDLAARGMYGTDSLLR